MRFYARKIHHRVLQLEKTLLKVIASYQEDPRPIIASSHEDSCPVIASSSNSKDWPSSDTSVDTTSDASSVSSSDTSRLAWSGHKLMLPKKPSKVAMKLSKKLKKPKPSVLLKPPPSKKTQMLLDSFLQHAAMDPDQTAWHAHLLMFWFSMGLVDVHYVQEPVLCLL